MEKMDDEKLEGEAYPFGTGGRRGAVGQVFVLRTAANGAIETASVTGRNGSVDDGTMQPGWAQRIPQVVATVGPGGGILGGRRPSIPLAVRSFTSPIDIV